MMKIVAILVMTMAIEVVQAINFKYTKRNVQVPKDSQYMATVEIQRQNAELTPMTIELQSGIVNTIPSYNNHFDYFDYLTEEDSNCYSQSVYNHGYLYPCPFLQNKNTVLKAS